MEFPQGLGGVTEKAKRIIHFETKTHLTARVTQAKTCTLNYTYIHRTNAIRTQQIIHTTPKRKKTTHAKMREHTFESSSSSVGGGGNNGKTKCCNSPTLLDSAAHLMATTIADSGHSLYGPGN